MQTPGKSHSKEKPSYASQKYAKRKKVQGLKKQKSTYKMMEKEQLWPKTFSFICQPRWWGFCYGLGMYASQWKILIGVADVQVVEQDVQ